MTLTVLDIVAIVVSTHGVGFAIAYAHDRFAKWLSERRRPTCEICGAKSDGCCTTLDSDGVIRSIELCDVHLKENWSTFSMEDDE